MAVTALLVVPVVLGWALVTKRVYGLRITLWVFGVSTMAFFVLALLDPSIVAWPHKTLGVSRWEVVAKFGRFFVVSVPFVLPFRWLEQRAYKLVAYGLVLSGAALGVTIALFVGYREGKLGSVTWVGWVGDIWKNLGPGLAFFYAVRKWESGNLPNGDEKHPPAPEEDV